MILKLMEWNIHQQGRHWNGKNKKSGDGSIPLWIVDKIPDDRNAVVFTEFNSHADNVEEFYMKLEEKHFQYSSTNYKCGWSNDVLIAIRGDDICVESISSVKAYPDLSNTNININYDTIPENLRIDARINERLVHIWGIRIKDLKSSYSKRKTEMKMLMEWVNFVDGINIIVGDFNNLRENTLEKDWNISELDKLLGENYRRKTPENHSWGVAIKEDEYYFDGYIKNDHLIYSNSNDIYDAKVELYNWDFLDKCNYSICEPKYGKSQLNIPVGEPDHGILLGEIKLNDD